MVTPPGTTSAGFGGQARCSPRSVRPTIGTFSPFHEATMSVFDTLRIATSGLTAQRLRMDVAASNIANAQTAITAEGGPYRPESVWFEPTRMGPGAGQTGVTATAILTPNTTPRVVFDPSDPAADENGFVRYPDVELATQMADLMGSARSYSMNATVVSAAKQNALDALELGR